jgi:hypothetical protein
MGQIVSTLLAKSEWLSVKQNQFGGDVNQAHSTFRRQLRKAGIMSCSSCDRAEVMVSHVNGTSAKLRITLRADSGFAREALIHWCGFACRPTGACPAAPRVADPVVPVPPPEKIRCRETHTSNRTWSLHRRPA